MTNPFEELFNSTVRENREREASAQSLQRESAIPTPLPTPKRSLPAPIPVNKSALPAPVSAALPTPERKEVVTLPEEMTFSLAPVEKEEERVERVEMREEKPMKVARRRSSGLILQERDIAILTILSTMRIAAAPHLLLALSATEYVDTTEAALKQRLRLLARQGFVRIEYAPGTSQALYLSTEKGNIHSYDDAATIPKSNGIGTSLAHALLLSYEIARIYTGEHAVGVGNRVPRIFTDGAIRKSVAAITRDDSRWVPRERDRDLAETWAITTRTGLHIPDLVAINAQGEVLVIEVETSEKSKRTYYSDLVDAYRRSGLPTLFVVGNTNSRSKPLGSVHRRLTEVQAPNVLVIDADMEWARPSGGSR